MGAGAQENHTQAVLLLGPLSSGQLMLQDIVRQQPVPQEIAPQHQNRSRVGAGAQEDHTQAVLLLLVPLSSGQLMLQDAVRQQPVAQVVSLHHRHM